MKEEYYTLYFYKRNWVKKKIIISWLNIIYLCTLFLKDK